MKLFSTITAFSCLFLFLIFSCKKTGSQDKQIDSQADSDIYIIYKGSHYADHNPVEPIQCDEFKFRVRFDSSCIYQTLDPSNQEDINKLFGFSDNNAPHQEFSARFGWNWAREALRLYAYIYNYGARESKEISAIEIGKEYACYIKIQGDKYIFSINDDITAEMDRSSKTPTAIGYKLYPYFGGDEAAPHDINIWIRE